MNVVFLDSDSLPLHIPAPAWVTDWQDRPDTPAEQVVEVSRHAHVLITNKVRIGRVELEQLPNLRFICVAATGYDCVDLAACRDVGVTVSNVPAYSAQSVAESVITSIFALRRQLFAYQRAARQDWPDSRHFACTARRSRMCKAACWASSAKARLAWPRRAWQVRWACACCLLNTGA